MPSGEEVPTGVEVPGGVSLDGVPLDGVSLDGGVTAQPPSRATMTTASTQDVLMSANVPGRSRRVAPNYGSGVRVQPGIIERC